MVSGGGGSAKTQTTILSSPCFFLLSTSRPPPIQQHSAEDRSQDNNFFFKIVFNSAQSSLSDIFFALVSHNSFLLRNFCTEKSPLQKNVISPIDHHLLDSNTYTTFRQRTLAHFNTLYCGSHTSSSSCDPGPAQYICHITCREWLLRGRVSQTWWLTKS